MAADHAAEPSTIERDDREAGPSIAARLLSAAATIREAAAAKWVVRAAAVLIVGVAVVGGGLYLWNLIATSATRARVMKAVESRTAAPEPATTGSAHVTSTPPGAHVVIDGTPRDTTPLTVADLRPGRHAVELDADAGSVHRTIVIEAGKTADVDEKIFSGWLALISPFDVAVSENGRALRLDDKNEIMLPPGRHQLRLVNEALAYDVVRPVELKPGETTRLRVLAPLSKLSVASTDAGEVWLDRAHIGDTPVNGYPIPIGAHDVIVKRADGVERSFTITVTVDPFVLNVDFAKQ